MTSTMTTRDVFEVVRRVTLEVLPDLSPSDVTIDGALVDLGANSIDRADIVTMVMEELDLIVPAGEFEGVRDLRSLVDVLYRHR